MNCSTKKPGWYQNLNWELISTICKKYSIDRNLLAAIIWQESRNNTYAMRFEPNWKYAFNCDYYAKKNGITELTEEVCQSTSWGLTQLMGTVVREMQWNDHLSKMLIPRHNLNFCCKKLRQLFDKYKNIMDVIAAYNAGSPRYSENGDYVNQEYVDSVYNYYTELKA